MSALFRRWLTEEGDTYVVSLVRMLLGIMLFSSGLRELGHLRTDAHFADVFHMPIVPEALVPGRALFAALVIAQLVLPLLIVFGRGARPALSGTAIVGLYLLSCDRLAYHNNRYALFLFALLLAFSPCDRAFAWRGAQNRPHGPLWAARLAQVQLALIYVASGGSKLLDEDWRGGLVLGDRLARSTAIAVSKGVPAGLVEALASPAVSSVLAKLAISTELGLAVALFLPRTRAFALWWGTMFHLTIELTSQVELFTWLSLTIYALFATPALRERALLYDLANARAVRLARMVRSLDWLLRFDIRADPAVRGFAVVDRDQSRAAGLLGYARIARATPLLFPFWIPLLAAAKLFSPPPEDARAAAC
jgi:hypothetical protein